MILTIWTGQAEPGKKQQCLKVLRDSLPQISKAPGCLELSIFADLHADLLNIEPVRDNAITVLGRWESRSAAEAAFRSPEVRALWWDAIDILATGSTRVLQTETDG